MDERVVDLGISGVDDAVEFARGGFSTVYRANQRAVQRRVAVKVINASALDGNTADHFLREARVAARLSQHPFIAPVYDVGRSAHGHPYLILPFYGRGSLATLMASGPVAQQQVTDLGIKLCDALQYTHDQGVVHRDIKPGNILISDSGNPALSDFGAARLSDASVSISMTGLSVVTWAYGPPEAFVGGGVTPAWDIYSLGATLFALLNGGPAYIDGDDVNVFMVLNRIGNAEPPDLRSRGVGPGLADTIRAAMAKDPGDRPQSALELGELLRTSSDRGRVIPGRPEVPAAPPPASSSAPPEAELPDKGSHDAEATGEDGPTVAELLGLRTAPAPSGPYVGADPEPALYAARTDPDEVWTEAEVARIEPAVAPAAMPWAAPAVVPPGPDVAWSPPAVAPGDPDMAWTGEDLVFGPPPTGPSSRPSRAAVRPDLRIVAGLVALGLAVVSGGLVNSAELGYDGTSLDGNSWFDLSAWIPVLALALPLVVYARRRDLTETRALATGALIVWFGDVTLPLSLGATTDTDGGSWAKAVWLSWISLTLGVAAVAVLPAGPRRRGRRPMQVPSLVLVLVGAILVFVGFIGAVNKADGEYDYMVAYPTDIYASSRAWILLAPVALFVLWSVVWLRGRGSSTAWKLLLVVGVTWTLTLAVNARGVVVIDLHPLAADITAMVGFAVLAVAAGVALTLSPRWRTTEAVGAAGSEDDLPGADGG